MNSSTQDNKSPSIAHAIKCLPGLELRLRESANAWWMDYSKVYRLLAAFEIDCTIDEACAYAGITKRQYKYFAQLHPEIREIRQMKRASLTIRAKVTIAKNLDNFKTAKWYLERTEPETYSKAYYRRKRQQLYDQEEKDLLQLQREVRDLAEELEFPSDVSSRLVSN